MNTKQRILWGLAAIVVVNAIVCWRANVIADKHTDEQRRVANEAAEVLLARTCADAADVDCEYAKNLGASFVQMFDWNSDVDDALRYVSSSGKYVKDQYSRTTELIDGFQREQRDPMKVANRVVNGYSGLKNNAAFDTNAFVEKVKFLDRAHDSANNIALWSGGIAAVAALPLILVGLWELFLAMVRSFRRAWNSPNG